MLSVHQGMFPYEGEENPDLINAGNTLTLLATHSHTLLEDIPLIPVFPTVGIMIQ